MSALSSLRSGRGPTSVECAGDADRSSTFDAVALNGSRAVAARRSISVSQLRTIRRRA